jgi:hypothetical protein
MAFTGLTGGAALLIRFLIALRQHSIAQIHGKFATTLSPAQSLVIVLSG